MSLIAILLVVTIVSGRNVTAQNQPAQNAASNSGTQFQSQSGPSPFGYPYPYTGFGMAGTPESSAEFGMASMISSAGYANLMNSEAANNYEQARSKDIHNKLLWSNAYFEMRRLHKAFIEDHHRMTMDEINKVAKEEAPKRLDPTRFDRATGQIDWPIILRDPKYAKLTGELEELFRTRVSTGYVTSENYLKIRQDCDKLVEQLRANVALYSADDFEEARHFLDDLRYEAHFSA
ncbi:MAG: hypothetical protein HYX69_04025 [Planctomycetia bacterium]|nr:hypothetical protein [Planctomycetia bacterium]